MYSCIFHKLLFSSDILLSLSFSLSSLVTREHRRHDAIMRKMPRIAEIEGVYSLWYIYIYANRTDTRSAPGIHTYLYLLLHNAVAAAKCAGNLCNRWHSLSAQAIAARYGLCVLPLALYSFQSIFNNVRILIKRILCLKKHVTTIIVDLSMSQYTSKILFLNTN